MAEYEIIAFYKEAKEEVKEHAEKFAELHGFCVRYEKYPEKEADIFALVGENSVVCMFNRDHMKFRKLLKYVYPVKKPALIFSGRDSWEAYNCLQVPVGFLQENKEKVVWANFFQRNNSQANIELLIPREKDEQISEMVSNNVDFIENIFANSGAVYKKNYLNLPFEKLLKAIFLKHEKALIFMMLPFRVFSFFIPYYLRIYNRYTRTQVLFIPRDEELYVPCH